MRKIKNKNGWQQQLKDMPKGVCDMCGGKGRYKETFKHKNPIIHHCWKCNGTGNVKIRVKYIGDTNIDLGLWIFSLYEVISENEIDYVILNRKNEMLQIKKDMFEVAK